MVLTLDGADIFTVAVPGVAGLRVAVTVSEPTVDPVTTPVLELIEEWALVSVQTTTQPAPPAATVLESEKVQKELVAILTVPPVVTAAGFGNTVIVVRVGAAAAHVVASKANTLPVPSGGPPITFRKQSWAGIDTVCEAHAVVRVPPVH